MNYIRTYETWQDMLDYWSKKAEDGRIYKKNMQKRKEMKKIEEEVI